MTMLTFRNVLVIYSSRFSNLMKSSILARIGLTSYTVLILLKNSGGGHMTWMAGS